METPLLLTTDNSSTITTTASSTNATVQTWWLIQLICRLTLNNSNKYNASMNGISNKDNDDINVVALTIAHNLECVYNDTKYGAAAGDRIQDDNDNNKGHRLYYRCALLKQQQKQHNQSKAKPEKLQKQIAAECESTNPPLSISTTDREIFNIETDFPRNVSLKLTNGSSDSDIGSSTTTLTTTVATEEEQQTSSLIAAIPQHASLIWLTLPKFPSANFSQQPAPIFREAKLECHQSQSQSQQRQPQYSEILSCTFVRHSSPPGNDDATTGQAATYDWMFLFVIVFIVAGGVGNVLVCLAVCMDRRLQNVTNYFLLSLAIADLLVCLFVMPLGAIQGFFGYWPLGIAWCNVYVSCDVLACSSSIMHMCCISLGRYLGIRNPLKTRHKYATKRLVGMKVALTWALSFAVSGSVTFLGLHNARNIMPEPRVCVINNRAFFVFGSLVAFYIPMLIMVVTYALTVQLLRKKARFLEHKTVGGETSQLKGADNFRRIGGRFRTGGKTAGMGGGGKGAAQQQVALTYTMASSSVERLSHQNRRLASTSSQSQTSLSDTVGENVNRTAISTISETMRTTDSNHDISKSDEAAKRTAAASDSRTKRLKSLRLQLNVTPSSFRFLTQKNKRQNVALGANAVRTEQKASKVLGLVFFTFVSCWTPFFALNILFAVCPRPHCQVPDHIVDITLWLGYVSSTINPIIYTIFNRTFRNAFVRLLQMKCKKPPIATRYRFVNDNRGSSALFAQVPTSSTTPSAATGVGVAAAPLSLSLQSAPSTLATPSSSGAIAATSKTIIPASRPTESIDTSEMSESTSPHS